MRTAGVWFVILRRKGYERWGKGGWNQFIFVFLQRNMLNSFFLGLICRPEMLLRTGVPD